MSVVERRALRLRRRLVDQLDRRGAIRTPLVREAFLAVPRELFVPEFAAQLGLEAVYRNEAIPTKLSASGMPLSSSSQPTIMAAMLERLRLEPGMRVLEIGAGTGYNAALLSHIVGPRGRVHTVEVDVAVATRARRALRQGAYRARVVTGDGRQGLPKGAPYDRIVVTASSATIPHAWHEQLVEGGIVEVPLRLAAAGAHAIASLEKHGSGLRSVSIVGGGFMPLREPGDEESLPAGLRSLIAVDLTRERRSQLRHLVGASLETLPPAAKQRLLATALGAARRRAIGLRAAPDALILYLTTTLPASRAVTVMPGLTIGLITRDGRSLAYVAWPGDGRTISSLIGFGAGDAEEALLRAVRAWDSAGRPTPEQLQISVTYVATEPRIRHRWRTPDRGMSR